MNASSAFVSPANIRAAFSSAMSAMYRSEVPLYGRLLEIVRNVNAAVLHDNPGLSDQLGNLDRVSEERHGAIRLGTSAELKTMAKLFAVMEMHPVGYYDLTVAGLPIHSTAFRPIAKDELARNPFRVFTSLLRTDLLAPEIQSESETILARRDIFTSRLRELLESNESRGGLSSSEADEFIHEALETFRWHSTALVSQSVYNKLLKINGLLADIVCFRGPHINHLTPRVLDIYRVHEILQSMDVETIPEVQGPPADCPILLKQTSFKALNEPIQFPESDGATSGGKHRARFGEIELRGCAITPEARAIYDRLILDVNREAKNLRQRLSADEYRHQYPALLNRIFRDGFPAWSLEDLRRQNLGYFHYHLNEHAPQSPELDPALSAEEQMQKLVAGGFVSATPITYEDFLPVSAAGIFKSNLDEQSGAVDCVDPNQALFEESLGKPVLDPFYLYREEQEKSIRQLLAKLQPPSAVRS